MVSKPAREKQNKIAKRDDAREELALAAEKLRLQHRAKLALIDKGYKLGRGAVGAAALVFCFYFIYASIDSIAGKTTTFSGVANAVVNLGINEYLAWGLSAVMGIGWANERRLRKRTIKEQGKHIKELETRVAPERQSSGLREDGTQREEDRDA